MRVLGTFEKRLVSRRLRQKGRKPDPYHMRVRSSDHIRDPDGRIRRGNGRRTSAGVTFYNIYRLYYFDHIVRIGCYGILLLQVRATGA